MRDFLEYKGFIGSVHFSAEDKIFHGKIEGINGLITFEGATVDELEKGFIYMVNEHIKDCEKEGIAIEKSYKGSFNIRISPELHRKAAQTAIKRGLSLNQLVSDILARELKIS
jgi:predicted HicB family RNase H-like nuclease